jgi:hypothetical protein
LAALRLDLLVALSRGVTRLFMACPKDWESAFYPLKRPYGRCLRDCNMNARSPARVRGAVQSIELVGKRLPAALPSNLSGLEVGYISLMRAIKLAA